MSVHSFHDDNGRTARSLTNHVPRYYGQPLTIVFREDRPAYFTALK